MAKPLQAPGFNDWSPPTTIPLQQQQQFSSPQISSRLGHRESNLKHREIRFGDYILGSTLGEGEFGKVKLGWLSNQKQPKQVAIKLIKKENIPPNSSRENKVRREINVLRHIRHPNIVHLEDVIHSEKYIGIVLDYASGGELFDYILANRYLRDNVACKLFAQLISGVSYIHGKGIVHRDLKLENLLLDERKNIIITDFGFANVFSQDNVQKGDIRADFMATSCGSPCYAAPELVVSERRYSARKADVWSCGIILYAMLAGYLPYDDDPKNPNGDNITRLYQYITSTPLKFPEYIMPMPRDLLRQVLVSDPDKRISLRQMKRHQWLLPHYDYLAVTPREWELYCSSLSIPPPRLRSDVSRADRMERSLSMVVPGTARSPNNQIWSTHQDNHGHGTSFHNLNKELTGLHISKPEEAARDENASSLPAKASPDTTTYEKIQILDIGMAPWFGQPKDVSSGFSSHVTLANLSENGDKIPQQGNSKPKYYANSSSSAATTPSSTHSSEYFSSRLPQPPQQYPHFARLPVVRRPRPTSYHPTYSSSLSGPPVGTSPPAAPAPISRNMSPNSTLEPIDTSCRHSRADSITLSHSVPRVALSPSDAGGEFWSASSSPDEKVKPELPENEEATTDTEKSRPLSDLVEDDGSVKSPVKSLRGNQESGRPSLIATKTHARLSSLVSDVPVIHITDKPSNAPSSNVYTIRNDERKAARDTVPFKSRIPNRPQQAASQQQPLSRVADPNILPSNNPIAKDRRSENAYDRKPSESKRFSLFNLYTSRHSSNENRPPTKSPNNRMSSREARRSLQVSPRDAASGTMNHTPETPSKKPRPYSMHIPGNPATGSESKSRSPFSSKVRLSDMSNGSGIFGGSRKSSASSSYDIRSTNSTNTNENHPSTTRRFFDLFRKRTTAG